MASVAVVLADGELLHDYAFRVTRERDDARAKLEALGRGLVQYELSLAAVEAERDTLRALLREVEWRGHRTVYSDGTCEFTCVLCLREQREGHAPDCRLKAALEGRDAVD